MHHEDDLVKDFSEFLLNSEKSEYSSVVTFQVGKDKTPINVYKNIIETRW